MATQMVRISAGAHRVLGELAERSGESMQAVLDKALEAYRRQCFLEGLAADFAALRSDPEAWKEELEERAVWEGTLMDDLEDEPVRTPTASGRKRGKR